VPGQWMASLTSAAVALAIAPCLWGQQFDAAEETGATTPNWAVASQPAEATVTGRGQLATVRADRVYMRCGPSRDYYPTGILNKGAQVRVLRQRPDGWVAIEPPEGSYSWVASEFVREVEPGVGEVIANAVPAWIGSDISPLRDHSQVTLRKGQRIRIRKKHVFPEDALQRVWLQIDPPEGEVRWVRGEYLSFGSETLGQIDPTQPPPSGSAVEFRGEPGEQPAIVADEVRGVDASGEAASRSDGDEHATEYALQLFRDTERLFAEEMQKPLGERDILSLKARYKQVIQLTTNPALRKVAQSRLELLEKEEVRERLARRFIELVRRSREKDQQLLRYSYQGANPSDGFAASQPFGQPQRGTATPSGAVMGQMVGAGGDEGFGSRWFEDPFAEKPSMVQRPQPQMGQVGGAHRPGGGIGPNAETSGQVVLPPGYRMIEGVLHPAGRGPDGRGRYVVRDPRSGRVIGYVVETLGLSLEPYIGKLVRISGRELRPSDQSGALMARRIEPVRRR